MRETRGDGTPRAVVTARELRRTSTEAEEHLWDALRGRRLKGLKLRRQHPNASFILDFFCVERQVAIELDGSVHDSPSHQHYDTARSDFLAERGIRVIRFTNDDVINDLSGVLKRIIDATSPSPDDVPFRRLVRGPGGEVCAKSPSR